MPIHHVTPLSGNVPRCTLLYPLTLSMPDDFTHQEESATTQCVNQTTCQLVHPVSGNVPDASYFILSLCLTPHDFTLQEPGECNATQ